MATRRPNVPRVSRPPRAQEAEHGAVPAEVIRADFRAGARGPVSQAAPSAYKLTAGTRRTSLEADASPVDGPAGKGSGQNARQGAAVNDAPRNQKVPAGESESPEDLDPVPAKAFSGRMLALAVVMVAITVMLAPTVKIFIDKRAEIAALNADIEDKEAEQAQLNQQISRWQDPNYVKQQARDRINMVMPGETSYWVFGSEVPAGNIPEAAAGAGAESVVEVPWVDALWESVRRSGTD